MATTGDEGRSSLRKAAGSEQTRFDPQMSEWGNPTVRSPARELTRRTETSKYPEEKKSTEIPLVVASERGSAQKCMKPSRTVWKGWP